MDGNTRIFNLPRAAGKSMRMIYASEFHKVPILCKDKDMKECLLDLSKRFGLEIPEPITINEIERGKLRGCRTKKVIIDEGYNIIANALKEYIGCEVAAVTLTDRIKEQAQFKQSLKSR